MNNCIFNNDECLGTIALRKHHNCTLCDFHTDMLNEVWTVSQQNNKKDRYTIVREGPIFTPGQMVKVAIFLDKDNEYSVIGELHYAHAQEIVDKMNKE